MSLVAKYQAQIAGYQAQQAKAKELFDRCDGAIQALRGLLGEAMQAEDEAASANGVVNEETSRL